MTATLAELLNSPNFLRDLAKLQEIAQAEQQRRERFYEEITPELKWEFINGEVVMHSPASNYHTDIRERVGTLLRVYVHQHQLGWCGGEKVLVTFSRNDYEPDYVFFGLEKSRTFTRGLLRHPVPDLAVEILSESTQARDRGIKFQDFAAHGVQEYWIIDPWTNSVEQYLLVNDIFELETKSPNGLLKSVAIKGLVLPITALFDEEECQRVAQAFRAGQSFAAG